METVSPESSQEPIDTTSTPIEARVDEPDAALPVPSGPLQTHTPGTQPRQSFWKRISMRRAQRLTGAGVGDVATRLMLIEQRLEHTQDTIRTQLTSLETRIDEVWEVEEQLSHLAEIQEKLDDVVRRQLELMDAVERRSGGGTSPTLIFVLAAVGAALGVLAASLLSSSLG